MKINLLLLCAPFVLTGYLQAQELGKEETAVKKVIEDESHWFNQRNFDKWAECVAHDPMTYFTWTTPFSGKTSVYTGQGWEQISRDFKKFTEEWPVENSDQKKENYQFKVNGNMAYVTFQQDGGSTAETRVLEKKDGQWRILRMEALASKAFHNMHQKYALQRMCGEWEVDPASVKEEGGNGWALIGGTEHYEKTDAGIRTRSAFQYKTEDGTVSRSTEEGTFSVHIGTGKIGVFNTAFYSNGWTTAAYGEAEIDGNGNLNIDGKMPGSKANAKGWLSWLDDNTLQWKIEVMNEKGEKIYAASYSLKRDEDADTP
ncbi:MAG: hypothetical protein R2791_12750 [Saprospiraceae bacterium]